MSDQDISVEERARRAAETELPGTPPTARNARTGEPEVEAETLDLPPIHLQRFQAKLLASHRVSTRGTSTRRHRKQWQIGVARSSGLWSRTSIR